MNDTQRAHGRKTADQSTVYIIDDDASMRIALERLLISAGIHVRTFASTRHFLEAKVPLDGACIISDVKMHGMTGLELQRKLRADGARVFFIFVTAYDTDEARSEAKQAGAIAYFRKPVDDMALLDAIEWASSRMEKKA